MSIRFDDVCGNAHAKRAAEVALAGGHAILFIGAHESDAEHLARTVARYAVEDHIQGHTSLPRASAGYVQPCPCGHFGATSNRECLCSPESVHSWRLEHWWSTDITVQVYLPDANEVLRWLQAGCKDGEPDERILERVRRCREQYKELDIAESVYPLLRGAITQLCLSPDQVKQALRVANTIACLAAAEQIETVHAAEAISYRRKP